MLGRLIFNTTLEPTMISKHTDISHTSTTKAILVVVSDGFGGYGDFLLGLKLASALKQQYIDAGTIKPEIYLVTQPSGKRKIEQLNGDEEFDIIILTPQTLQQMVELKKLQVGHIIETPVLSADLMGRIDCALMQNKIKASLTQVTEYSYGRPSHDSLHFRKKLRNICYKSTIYSGFQCDEMGIVLTPAISKIQTPVLDEEIREPLMGLQSRDEYLGLTELSFQYSHDIHSQRPSATHFLNIHREFIKNSSKNHDIIMIGSSEEHKFQAFLSIKDGLIADGFQSISFYNINTKTERFLYENGVSGRKYRVLYTTTMSHRSMMACHHLSSILVGASGDQSFGEAVSADKIGVYECLSHKYYFIQAYDAAMISTSQSNPVIQEMLFLLRFANTPETYQRLGILIRSTENQALFSALNAKAIHQGHLIDTIMRVGLQTNLAFRAHITKLLSEGYQQEALFLFNANKEKLTVFDEYGGKSIIEYAIENDTFGDFTQYFLNIQNLLLQYIFSQKQNEALALIKEENIDPASKINGLFILEIAIANHCHILEKQLTSMIKQQLLEETSCLLDFGEQRKALLFLKTHPLKELIHISVFERIHGKSLIQYAQEHDPEGVFSKHFDDEREVFFHYLMAGEYTQAAEIAAKMRWSPYTKINGKYLIQICDDFDLPQLGADIRQRYHVELGAQGINPDAWEVVTLLKQGREQEALEYLLAQLSTLTIFDLFNDTSIIDHAIQHNPQGPFALYFEEPKHRLSQCFFSKKYCEAAHIIREQRTLLVYPYTVFRGEYIIDSFNAAGLC